ncbi:LysR family transcriptional regulator [Pluralibacter gergoviae]|uniref:LysR family transcriptional regulator n=1 Tax=Pluralibacter gergoviae TaxID=61647 RepID=A0AAI9DMJ6_PLUGE|nr:LysR family transcriptional regulator [Pluralibacter gergoviae]EKV0916289.1 LysR family transcriptional regulator [Pluralibacter gergoviae]EKV9906957.1 LysR family transcriptional regulator [Pluralibacter gergoviae]EKW7272663.1 LysR family transcriptional regulator [Pluralibacter gergoviae]ELD4294721.1 LysR family transcriptional regulator [Pluralibacter gergoviae]ELD4306923.1 LysR family transcriptional regulator [Pluralibacter gergoviae]
MITFKQMDALIWIVNLGSFEAAAEKLNMTQSAISKRIRELEESFDIDVFDRKSRNARLTEKGRELLMYCQEIVERRNQMLERVSDKKVLISQLRIGVTELTAMTWLPVLIEKIRDVYPKIQIIPTIDDSPVLYDQVINDKLDIIIAPDMYDDVRLNSCLLHSVENVWMCSTSLIPVNKKITLEEAGKYSFFVQGPKSGTGLIFERYFTMREIRVNKNIVCNNLNAQIGLTVAGMGITYLPRNPLKPLLEAGVLRELAFKPRLPLIRYSAIYRTDRERGIIPHMAEIAKSCCCFDKFLLAV